MFYHKFFVTFKPAPLSSFFAINGRLSPSGSRRTLRLPKPAASKKSGSSKKAA